MLRSLRQLKVLLYTPLMALAFFSALAVTTVQVNSQTVSAATCGSEPTTTTGKSTQTITVPTTDTYTIWSRVKAPDASAVEYKVYVDGQCFTIGQTSLTPNTLTWVDYQDGSVASKATVTLSAGQHTLVLTAGTENLELDRVMLLSGACTPADTGDNCQNDTTAPTTSLTSPTNGATVTATTVINANASDNDAVDYVEFYQDGTALLGSDSTAPYSYSWDTTLVADGTYSLTVRAYDLSGNVQTGSAINVTVGNTPAIPANITSFGVAPSTITNGQSSTLSWSVDSGTACTINNGVGSVGVTGSQPVSPTDTTTYTLSCDGQDGGAADTAQATVTVNPAPVNANIASFSATPSTITTDQSSTLSWSVSAGQGCVIDQSIGAVGLTGARSVSPTVTTTYTLTCQGQYGGSSDSESATLTVNAPVNATIEAFSASPAIFTPTQNITLTWDVNTGTGCSIDNGVGVVSLTGTQIVNPNADTYYTLTCEGIYGGASATRTTQVLIDSDGDGVPDKEESGYVDGTPGDNLQPSIVNVVNATTAKYNTLKVTGDCTTFGNTKSANKGGAKATQGVWSFALTCPAPGQSATVEIYLDKVYDTSAWKVVKNNDAFSVPLDITNRVTFTVSTKGAKSVTVIRFILTDGGDLDQDGVANGVIIDPLGIEEVLGVSKDGAVLAPTGMNFTAILAIATIVTVASLLAVGHNIRRSTRKVSRF